MLKMKISWNSILTHGESNLHTYFQFYNILKSRSRACSWLFSDILFYIYFISFKCTKTPKFVTHMYLLHIENDSLQNDFSLGLSNKDTAMKHNWKKKSKFYKSFVILSPFALNRYVHSSCYNANASWYLIHLRIWALELENYNILMLSYKRDGYQNRNHTGNIVSKLPKPPLQKYMCALLLLRNNSFLY